MDNPRTQINSTTTMIERMYWQHGYTEEDIVQRLRVDPRLVQAIARQDRVETRTWDEDQNEYRVTYTARTRPVAKTNEGINCVKTPLHGIEQTRLRVEGELAENSNRLYSIQTPLHRLDTASILAVDPAARFLEWIETVLVGTGIALWIMFWANLHIRGIV